MVHAAMAVLMWRMRIRVVAEGSEPGVSGGDRPLGTDGTAEDVGVEPELLRVRTLALWMSRLTLPATFVVSSSLLAAMPTLPLIRRLDPTAGTVLASVWMGARWAST